MRARVFMLGKLCRNAEKCDHICGNMRLYANFCINKYSKCINKYSKFWKCHYMRENMQYAHFCKICEICCDRMIAINRYPYLSVFVCLVSTVWAERGYKHCANVPSSLSFHSQVVVIAPVSSDSLPALYRRTVRGFQQSVWPAETRPPGTQSASNLYTYAHYKLLHLWWITARTVLGEHKCLLALCQFLSVVFARWQHTMRLRFAPSGNGKESFSSILDPDADLDHQ